MSYTIISREDTWEGLGQCVAKRLVDHEKSPIIAVGLNGAASIEYLPKSSLDEDSEEKVWQDAEKALVARWNDADFEVEITKIDNYCMYTGDDLTSSDICNTTLLQKMHTILDSSEIYVSIPSRTTLFAGIDEEEIQDYTRSHFISTAEEGMPTISAGTFKVENSKLISFTPQELEAPEFPSDAWNVSKANLVPSQEGSSLHIRINVRDSKFIAHAVQSELNNYLNVREEESFDGSIVFLIP